MKKQSSKSTRGRSQDRKLVSSEPHETRYEAGKLGVSEKRIAGAKKSAGRSRKAIEKSIGK